MNDGLTLLRRDPMLVPLIEQFGPPTLQAETDPGRLFGRLVAAIISQQVSVKASDAIMRRLAASMANGSVTPEGVLALGVDGLRTVGASGAKARYLLDLGARVAGGKLALERLPDLHDAAVIERLTQVKGIGVWTAQARFIC